MIWCLNPRLSMLENILARVRNPLGIHLEYDKIQENKQAYIEDGSKMEVVFDVCLFILLDLVVLQLNAFMLV